MQVCDKQTIKKLFKKKLIRKDTHCKALCNKVCQWLVTGTSVSSNNKIDHHDISEILLK